MYDTSFLVCVGIGLSVLGFLFGGIRGFRAVAMSIGMTMLFMAWLQFINFDGNWPKDQEFIKYYTPTDAEMDRINKVVKSTDTMSDEDWEDYSRCKTHHVCMRKFHRNANLIEPIDSAVRSGGGCVTINNTANCSTLTNRK